MAYNYTSPGWTMRKYTQNNASWCDLGYVDVSSQYTNETVTNAITIEGAS